MQTLLLSRETKVYFPSKGSVNIIKDLTSKKLSIYFRLTPTTRIIQWNIELGIDNQLVNVKTLFHTYIYVTQTQFIYNISHFKHIFTCEDKTLQEI